MEDLFLKAKHWQLFALLITLNVIVQAFFAFSLILSNYVPLLIILTAVVGGTFMFLFLSWFYYLIKGLNKKNHIQNLKTDSANLNLFYLFPVVYILVISLFLPSGFTVSTEESDTISALSILIIVPTHLFSMYCIFYLMYKAAKTIKTAEVQKPVSFGDFAGEFFLLWFFPIGIWFLQPKINKLAE